VLFPSCFNDEVRVVGLVGLPIAELLVSCLVFPYRASGRSLVIPLHSEIALFLLAFKNVVMLPR